MKFHPLYPFFPKPILANSSAANVYLTEKMVPRSKYTPITAN
jgi:hypothetical protein